MLVATFGPTTTWAGKTVTYADGAFVLEGHGPIRAQDVFEYERQGHLVWAMDGVRAWVGAKAQEEGGPAATPLQTVDWQTGQAANTGSPEASADGSPGEPEGSGGGGPSRRPRNPKLAASVPPVASVPPADPVRERALEFGARRRLLCEPSSRLRNKRSRAATAGRRSPGDVFLSLADRAIEEGRSAHDWPRLGRRVFAQGAGGWTRPAAIRWRRCGEPGRRSSTHSTQKAWSACAWSSPAMTCARPAAKAPAGR